MRRCSICGRGWFRGDHDSCTRTKGHAGHVAWFERTGHCGQCGQPGDYCLCGTAKRDRCGCHELHPVGSGLAADAVDQFSASTVEQGELFG